VTQGVVRIINSRFEVVITLAESRMTLRHKFPSGAGDLYTSSRSGAAIGTAHRNLARWQVRELFGCEHTSYPTDMLAKRSYILVSDGLGVGRARLALNSDVGTYQRDSASFDDKLVPIADPVLFRRNK
jgi:hypothetical protein